jgi:hypothetical protein
MPASVGGRVRRPTSGSPLPKPPRDDRVGLAIVQQTVMPMAGSDIDAAMIVRRNEFTVSLGIYGLILCAGDDQKRAFHGAQRVPG